MASAIYSDNGYIYQRLVSIYLILETIVDQDKEFINAEIEVRKPEKNNRNKNVYNFDLIIKFYELKENTKITKKNVYEIKTTKIYKNVFKKIKKYFSVYTSESELYIVTDDESYFGGVEEEIAKTKFKKRILLQSVPTNPAVMTTSIYPILKGQILELLKKCLGEFINDDKIDFDSRACLFALISYFEDKIMIAKHKLKISRSKKEEKTIITLDDFIEKPGFSISSVLQKDHTPFNGRKSAATEGFKNHFSLKQELKRSLVKQETL